MKRILFILLSMLGLCMYAQQRSAEQAIDVAEDFWNKSVQRNKLRAVSHEVVNAAVQKVRGKELDDGLKHGCYVVNDEENGRFVIVSADERLRTILGYSDNGTFDAEKVAPGLLDMISVYDEQYTSVYPYLDQLQKASQEKEGIVAISPLIMSKWDQDAPYNMECPMNKKSGLIERCVTGCVATAMAQVMNYYKYPDCGMGMNQYVSNKQGIEQSMDFSTITIDWNNMMNEYGFLSTNAQKSAVAKLMHACGVSVNMDYGSSSSSSSAEMAYSLMKFWKYNPNLALKRRDFYRDEEWNSIIYEELSVGHPILYSGTGNGGHQFILDGCDKDGRYHFNFGWSGYGDGYYAIDALIPRSSSGSKLGNYSYDQDMVCYVTPEMYGQKKGEFTASESLGLNSQVKVGSTIEISSYIFNREASFAGRYYDGGSKFNGEIGVGLFDKDFNHVLSLCRRDASLDYFHGRLLNKEIELNKSVFFDGAKYYIAFYAYSDDFGYAIARTKGGESDYYLATVKGDIVTFEAMKQMDGDTPELPVYTDIIVEENKAGELSERITNQEMLTATHWTISGELNGTDIAFLREAFQIGRITSLDLTDARIVKGGEPYYEDSYFSYCTEDNVIGGKMFQDAESLETLNLPSTTSRIDGYAIDGCGITTISIPNSCISIKDFGICYCSRLESVHIGTGLVELEDYGILSCPLFKSFNVDEGNTVFKSAEGVLYSKDGTTLYGYPQGKSESIFKVPDSVKVIAGMAFCYASFNHVVLPYGLKRIESYAFSYCENLEEIDLPQNLMHIGDGAFNSCKKLKEITVPDQVDGLHDFTFSNCISLQHVHVGSGVETVSGYAFYGNTALQTITVSEMSNTFTSLDGVLYSKSLTSLVRCPQALCMNRFVVNQKVTMIDNNAFRDCVNIREFVMPEGLEVIQDNAFSGCQMETLDLPSSVWKLGKYAFYQCKRLRRFVVPNKVKEVSSHLLCNCDSLEYLYLPDGINMIQWYSFLGCSQLRMIESRMSNLDMLEVYHAFDGIADDCKWHVEKGRTSDYVLQPWWESTWIIEENMESGISSLNGCSNEDVHMRSEGGTLIISAKQSTTIHILDIDGKEIIRVPLTSGIPTSVALPKGVYIVRGRKIMVM